MMLSDKQEALDSEIVRSETGFAIIGIPAVGERPWAGPGDAVKFKGFVAAISVAGSVSE